MPRPKPGPKEYVSTARCTAYQVAEPYHQVARWCGGKLVKAGMKFDHIEVSGYSTRAWAHKGDYIVRIRPGVYAVWSKGEFEGHWSEESK